MDGCLVPCHDLLRVLDTRDLSYIIMVRVTKIGGSARRRGRLDMCHACYDWPRLYRETQ